MTTEVGGGPRWRLARRVRADAGSVTVEFALVVPTVVLVAWVVTTALGVTSQSVRLADAAAVAARQAARGDRSSVAATVAALAPGATPTESGGTDLVCIDLRRDVALGPLSTIVTLTSRSCAPTAGR